MSQKTSKTPQEKKMKHLSFKLKASTIIIMGIFMGGNVYADTSSTSLWDGLSGAYKEAKRGISKTADQVSQAIESAKNTVINAISKNQEESQKIAAQEAQNTQKAQQTSIVTFTQGLTDEEKKRQEEQALKDQQKQEAANQYNANNGGVPENGTTSGDNNQVGINTQGLSNVVPENVDVTIGVNRELLGRVSNNPQRGNYPLTSNMRMRFRTGGVAGNGASTTLSFHTGIDIGTPTGTPILSAADGIVTHAGWISGFGNSVAVAHDGKITTFYAHLSKINPNTKVGVKLKKGQELGRAGATGGDYPQHLHFEILHNAVLLDPLDLNKLRNNMRVKAGFRSLTNMYRERIVFDGTKESGAPQYSVGKQFGPAQGTYCSVKPKYLRTPSTNDLKLAVAYRTALYECYENDPNANLRGDKRLINRGYDADPAYYKRVAGALNKYERTGAAITGESVSTSGSTPPNVSDTTGMNSSENTDPGEAEVEIIEGYPSYKDYEEYVEKNKDKPIVWVDAQGRIFATPAYNSKYGAGGNGTGRPSFIIPMGNAKDYAPDKLEAAGCAPGVWSSMYETYLQNAQDKLEVGLQTQIEDQIASTPPLAQDCFANIMEALERLRKAYEKAADIINGNFKITIDWEALYKMARERAIEFACKVINEKIINGVLPWDTITYFINTADTVGNITNVINSQVGADVIIHQENPNATKTNTGNGSSGASTK